MNILRDIGSQTTIPLVMGVSNRLKEIPKTDFLNYPYDEELNDVIDAGVLLISSTSNGAVIRWTVETNGWFAEDEDEEESEDYESDGRFYIQVALN